MGTKKKYLTVYTVSTTVVGPSRGTEHAVCGSFLTRGAALREATKEMLEMLEQDEQAYATLICDPVHGDVMDVATNPGALEDAIRDELGGQGCFIIGDGKMTFRVDVDENDVESATGLPLWVCVTSGTDEEEHDPEFEQAYPEVFLSEDAATKCALRDLFGYLEGAPAGDKDAIMFEAEKSLSVQGYCSYQVKDGKMRRWDIWRCPVDIGQGAVHSRRP